jgi:hypothetical protein
LLSTGDLRSVVVELVCVSIETFKPVLRAAKERWYPLSTLGDNPNHDKPITKKSSAQPRYELPRIDRDLSTQLS